MVETLPSAYTHLATIQSDLGNLQKRKRIANSNLAFERIQRRIYLSGPELCLLRTLPVATGKMVEAKANIEQALAIVEIKDSLCYSSCQTVGGLILYQAGETKRQTGPVGSLPLPRETGFYQSSGLCLSVFAALYFAEGNEHKFLYYAKSLNPLGPN